MSLIYRDDVGVDFTFSTLDTNIPPTNTISIVVKKPDASIVNWTPTYINFMTGDVNYKSVAGDLSLTGDYQVQIMSVDGTEILRSEIGTFTVYEKLY